MVEVICDTNFLIHLATKRIKNIDSIDTEIGSISYVVPEVVKNELIDLKDDVQKKQDILTTIDFIKNFKIIPIHGKYADKELINHVKKNRGIIGTMDKELKNKIKQNGGSVISFRNDKMILES
ncbi:MAG: twitching motility protein PilT [Nitrosopumilaceae archaeon]|uniref:Twitching motility protein PilT n=3 Tax=Candidatus Nitrosomaritimum aestuariumsis TaxID=3342354 RepID=A0AC60VWJ9_9ARCH|nr:twitching motility protein PilT [Nitrosopumilaceae archaeon]MBA4454827.1 twitching motility protein PilT [Nitrosopumilaceae archaeon]MBA4460820.1 twitching motility protein PilT [Nitrosopumilaceae archaeon]MBA4461345.1 twitching motility protein PilT [Nitrosopumilaceae archaeon]MBA4463379.1 twitching motility protein PilT [Nitrosopumilaceae archaeon]